MTLVAAVVVSVAVYLSVSRLQTTESSAIEFLLFPDLAGQLNQVRAVRIRSSRQTTTVRHAGPRWEVVEKSGYPADIEAVRNIALVMSRMRVLESKTSNPERYQKLDLDDITKQSSKAVEISLLNQDDSSLVSLLVGRSGERDSRFVRLTGEAQSYLVSPDIRQPLNPVDWVEKTILDLERNEIELIRITHPDGNAVTIKSDGKGGFELLNIPEGSRVKYQFAINDFASALDELELVDVKRGKNTTDKTKYRGEVTTTGGLVLSFHGVQEADKTWFSFQAIVGKDMNTLTDWDGWLYTLEPSAFTRLVKPMSELVEDIPNASGGVDSGQQ